MWVLPEEMCHFRLDSETYILLGVFGIQAEFQIEVNEPYMVIYGNITENRLRHASGPVQTTIALHIFA